MDQAAKGVEDATLPVSIEAQTPNTTLPSTSQIQIAASVAIHPPCNRSGLRFMVISQAPIPSLDRTQNDSGFGQSLPPAGGAASYCSVSGFGMVVRFAPLLLMILRGWREPLHELPRMVPSMFTVQTRIDPPVTFYRACSAHKSTRASMQQNSYITWQHH